MTVSPEDIVDPQIREWFCKKHNPKKLINAQLIDTKTAAENGIQTWVQDGQHYVVDKFATLKDFELQTKFDFFSCDIDKQYNICLLYAVWNNPLYLKLLYLSLISQFYFTDVKCIDIKVFVDHKLEAEARALLPSFVKVIKVSQNLNKHYITLHPSLKEYDRIIISDCDTFFFGEQRELYRYISESNNKSLCMMKYVGEKVANVLGERVVLSKFKKVEEYLEELANLLSITVPKLHEYYSRIWYLSCLIDIPSYVFTSKDWEMHVKACQNRLGTWCDETVFLTYAWTRDIKVVDLSSLGNDIHVVLAPKTKEFMKDPKGLGIIHPLHGSFCHDTSVIELYEKISNLEHSVPKNTDHLKNNHVIPRNNYVKRYPEICLMIGTYGSNHVIRQSSLWPDDVPLPIGIQHSYDSSGDVRNDFRRNILQHFWVYGEREENFLLEHKEGNPQHIWKCGHPCLYLPKSDSITRNGTLAMPKHGAGSHSPVHLDKYFKLLCTLPTIFHPITVCLTNHDLQHAKIARDLGLNCLTMGDGEGLFYEYQREVMQRYEYVTSNYNGSPMWLSLHWGCKFFYLGEPAEMFNSTKNSYWHSSISYPHLFSIDRVEDSLSHHDLVDLHLGRLYKKSPVELRQLLLDLTKDCKYKLWVTIHNEYKDDKDNFIQRLYVKAQEWTFT